MRSCSVDQLSSYRCELDEIQDKNELSRAPFMLFGVGVATRQVFRGSSDGFPKFMVGVYIHVIVLCEVVYFSCFIY